MTERAEKMALWMMPEAAFDEDPDPDGSSYKNWPVDELSDLEDLKEQLETDQQEGTLHGKTAPQPGADACTFKAKGPLVGFATAGGVGAAPPTADWFDDLLAHVFSAAISETGQDVGVGSTTSSLVLSIATGGLQSLNPVYEAGLPSNVASQRTQWAMNTDAGPTTFAVAPSFVTAPTTAAIRYATRTFLPSDKGGPTFAGVHRMDDIDTTITGIRCTQMKWVINARKKCYWEATFVGTTQNTADAAKTQLPAATKYTNPHIHGIKSPVWHNGTRLGTANVEIEWGITPVDVLATEGNQGLANRESGRLDPKITITPIWTNTIRNLKRNITTGPTQIQIGGGVFDGTRLGTICVHFAEAFAEKADPKKDGQIRRAGVTLVASKMGIFSGTTLARFCQVARA